MNLISFGQGTKGETVTFPVSQVQDVRIGAGWVWRGIGRLILPYVKPIEGLGKGVAGSFVAPDGSPDGGVYASHLHTPDDTQALARLLKGEATA